ncbi:MULTISPECIES: polysaccharide deacetylase family protein [Paenibacillus]|uniref:polysaccharide deacetylase family protein n=1 Tax=Paenibacillus TaxID=44249 RepID=UPI000421DDA5|nr:MULTISPECIES: polysaccharide deacetylase family protein [Paenibacillus]KEO80220.1 polysaccharide deacetylase [Paenibacillus polymyxa]MCH6186331.1 polysaccharide deacetylase family protein [Paenibacillus polymyxa]UMY56103.1 polysaccharide deacetylase family protein [Paenibacillus peoriae]WRL60673.1 polysaccharide deacetylase family protein [Paenibacillus polymyxa]
MKYNRLLSASIAVSLFCASLCPTTYTNTAQAASYTSPTPTKGRAYYEERGDIVWEVPTHRKLIALTFDDGPDGSNTPAILDLLKEYDAKATFFVVGSRVEKLPHLVKREREEGHEVGNHTFLHSSFQYISRNKALSELDQAQASIVQATGAGTHLFRPPGGSYTDSLVKLSKEKGLKIILWSWHQDTLDWRKPGVHRIANKVLRNVRNGDIVLMHDYVYKSTQTVEALKIILPELKKRGFTFVTVSELLANRKTPEGLIEVNK